MDPNWALVLFFLRNSSCMDPFTSSLVNPTFFKVHKAKEIALRSTCRTCVLRISFHVVDRRHHCSAHTCKYEVRSSFPFELPPIRRSELSTSVIVDAVKVK